MARTPQRCKVCIWRDRNCPPQAPASSLPTPLCPLASPAAAAAAAYRREVEVEAGRSSAPVVVIEEGGGPTALKRRSFLNMVAVETERKQRHQAFTPPRPPSPPTGVALHVVESREPFAPSECDRHPQGWGVAAPAVRDNSSWQSSTPEAQRAGWGSDSPATSVAGAWLQGESALPTKRSTTEGMRSGCELGEAGSEWGNTAARNKEEMRVNGMKEEGKGWHAHGSGCSVTVVYKAPVKKDPDRLKTARAARGAVPSAPSRRPVDTRPVGMLVDDAAKDKAATRSAEKSGMSMPHHSTPPPLSPACSESEDRTRPPYTPLQPSSNHAVLPSVSSPPASSAKPLPDPANFAPSPPASPLPDTADQHPSHPMSSPLPLPCPVSVAAKSSEEDGVWALSECITRMVSDAIWAEGWRRNPQASAQKRELDKELAAGLDSIFVQAHQHFHSMYERKYLRCGISPHEMGDFVSDRRKEVEAFVAQCSHKQLNPRWPRRAPSSESTRRTILW